VSKDCQEFLLLLLNTLHDELKRRRPPVRCSNGKAQQRHSLPDAAGTEQGSARRSDDTMSTPHKDDDDVSCHSSTDANDHLNV